MEARDIPASIGQRLMWLKGVHEGRSHGLICPLLCRIEGPLNVGVLQAAIAMLAARHESLRTRFTWRGHSLRQLIDSQADVRVQVHDLSTNDCAESALERLLAKELDAPINPFESTVRVRLWRLARGIHFLCINLHHLVTDTVSCCVLHRELASAYDQLIDGAERLPPTGWQLSQFMAWQERQIRGAGFQRHRDYWHARLRGAAPPRLPLAPASPRRACRRDTLTAGISSDAMRGLQALAAQYGTTLFVLALSAYYVALARVTGQDDLTMSTLLANRTRPEVESTVGFIANLIALRAHLGGGGANFVDVVERTRHTVVDAIAHQELPYHVASDGSTVVGAARLDEVVFQMLSESIGCTYGTAVEFRGVVPDLKGRFDFELAVMPLADTLAIKLHWTADRLADGWAPRFLACYADAMARLANHPCDPIDVVLADLAWPT